jgi:hypothetical protein
VAFFVTFFVTFVVTFDRDSELDIGIVLCPRFAENLVPKILEQLSSGPQSPTENLETQQALVKQFAEILHFTLKFDELKVSFQLLRIRSSSFPTVDLTNA